MRYEIFSVTHYIVTADSFEEAVENAMDGDYIQKDEEFPDVKGWGGNSENG